MTPTFDKIIVSCDNSQKDTAMVGGVEIKTAHNFGTNYRERSPTIATVVQGNSYVYEGDVLLCHHNLYYLPSPYHLSGNLFSVPFSKVLFGRINEQGDAVPICGNIFGSKVDIPSSIPLPPDQRKKYGDRLVVEKSSNPKYKKGQLLFTRPSSCYDICYTWNGEEKMVTKISDDMICGILQ